MDVKCIWEHNGNDTILYARDYIGAFTRGQSLKEAVDKMPMEIISYMEWLDQGYEKEMKVSIVQEKKSKLDIKDADSDVLFFSEESEMKMEEYQQLKEIAMKSAKDFLELYEAIPNKNISCLVNRKTFYGQVPCTGEEMYQHTKNVNAYYFGEIGVDVDNEGTIVQCRERGFHNLENQPDFLNQGVIQGSYSENWSLRKVLRRFIWHDRIHAKAMRRMALKTFGKEI